MESIRVRRTLMAAAMALAVAAAAVPARAAGFKDVATDGVTAVAIEWCAEQGIASGYKDGTFGPDEPVSEKAFLTMLARAFGTDVKDNKAPMTRYAAAEAVTAILDKDGSTPDTYDKKAAEKEIADFGSVPEKYRDAVASVKALGIMSGKSDGKLHGTDPVTRGQAAAIIYRTAHETESVALDISPRLSDGNVIDEKNVTALITKLKAAFPCNKIFPGYSAIGTKERQASNSIKTIVESYVVTGSEDDLCSTDTGCGGWAAYVCDYIFGQDAEFRESSLAEIRPGDLMLKLDPAGKLVHVQVCVNRIRGSAPDKSVRITNANNGLGTPTAAGTTEYRINWTNDLTAGSAWHVYTAYPE